MAYLSCGQIIIPPLHSSFPLTIHNNHVKIREKVDHWMLSKFNPSSNEQRELLLESKFHHMASTCYANGEESRVVSIGKFLAWGFAFDDINDDVIRGMGGNMSQAEGLIQVLMDALDAKIYHGVHRIVTIALDWWNDIHPNITQIQQSRFLEANREAFNGFKDQIACRESSKILDVESYIIMRRKASCLFIMFILLEYSLGIELDEEILSNELISQLHDTVNDHASWVNDLLSLKREYSQGDYHNLPSVICFSDSHHDMQSSVDTVCKMIKERDGECIRLMHEIRSSKLIKKPGLESYLIGLGNYMAGNLHWSYVTARYHSMVDEEPRTPDAPLPILLSGPI